jgi:hypothetical protein
MILILILSILSALLALGTVAVIACVGGAEPFEPCYACTPEAEEWADRALQIPYTLMPRQAAAVGDEALRARAHFLLIDHAAEILAFPEQDRERYAVRIVGYALNNWLRKQRVAA